THYFLIHYARPRALRPWPRPHQESCVASYRSRQQPRQGTGTSRSGDRSGKPESHTALGPSGGERSTTNSVPAKYEPDGKP
ncbi:hypothetical protein EDD11_008961, partial [Mortierella claussenii]